MASDFTMDQSLAGLSEAHQNKALELHFVHVQSGG